MTARRRSNPRLAACLAACLAAPCATSACDQERGKGGASSTTPPAGRVAPPPPARLPELIEATLVQRAEVRLPDSKPAIVVAAGDVTGGAVVLIVETIDGETLVPARSMKEDEPAEFQLDGRRYSLRIRTLENNLVGDDFVHFEVRERGPAPTNGAASEATTAGNGGGTPPGGDSSADAIEALIQRVAARNDVTFIRNGAEHSSAEAADHMRLKWKNAGGRVRTIDDFIELCGSRSSLSGEIYRVRLPDGRHVESAEYLRSLRLAEAP